MPDYHLRSLELEKVLELPLDHKSPLDGLDQSYGLDEALESLNYNKMENVLIGNMENIAPVKSAILSSAEKNIPKELPMAVEEVFKKLDVSSKLIIKASVGSDIRRISIHNDDLTYDDLVLMMQRVFKSLISPDDDLLLKYKDEDGDLITITDTADLSFAIQYCRVLKLTVIINPEDLTNTNPENPTNVIQELINIRDRVTHLLDTIHKDTKQYKLELITDGEDDLEASKEQIAQDTLPKMTTECREFEPLTDQQNNDQQNDTNRITPANLMITEHQISVQSNISSPYHEPPTPTTNPSLFSAPTAFSNQQPEQNSHEIPQPNSAQPSSQSQSYQPDSSQNYPPQIPTPYQTTSQPTYSPETTSQPTYSQETTSQPTCSQETTSQPTYSQETLSQSTYSQETPQSQPSYSQKTPQSDYPGQTPSVPQPSYTPATGQTPRVPQPSYAPSQQAYPSYSGTSTYPTHTTPAGPPADGTKTPSGPLTSPCPTASSSYSGGAYPGSSSSSASFPGASNTAPTYPGAASSAYPSPGQGYPGATPAATAPVKGYPGATHAAAPGQGYPGATPASAAQGKDYPGVAPTAAVPGRGYPGAAPAAATLGPTYLGATPASAAPGKGYPGAGPAAALGQAYVGATPTSAAPGQGYPGATPSAAGGQGYPGVIPVQGYPGATAAAPGLGYPGPGATPAASTYPAYPGDSGGFPATPASLLPAGNPYKSGPKSRYSHPAHGYNN